MAGPGRAAGTAVPSTRSTGALTRPRALTPEAPGEVTQPPHHISEDRAEGRDGAARPVGRAAHLGRPFGCARSVSGTGSVRERLSRRCPQVDRRARRRRLLRSLDADAAHGHHSFATRPVQGGPFQSYAVDPGVRLWGTSRKPPLCPARPCSLGVRRARVRRRCSQGRPGSTPRRPGRRARPPCGSTAAAPQKGGAQCLRRRTGPVRRPRRRRPAVLTSRGRRAEHPAPRRPPPGPPRGNVDAVSVLPWRRARPRPRPCRPTAVRPRGPAGRR